MHLVTFLPPMSLVNVLPCTLQYNLQVQTVQPTGSNCTTFRFKQYNLQVQTVQPAGSDSTAYWFKQYNLQVQTVQPTVSYSIVFRFIQYKMIMCTLYNAYSIFFLGRVHFRKCKPRGLNPSTGGYIQPFRPRYTVQNTSLL